MGHDQVNDLYLKSGSILIFAGGTPIHMLRTSNAKIYKLICDVQCNCLAFKEILTIPLTVLVLI